MKFTVELLRDYSIAYRLIITRYKNLPLHFILASLFLLLVIGLETLIPYLLRQTINSLSEQNRSSYTASAIFMAGAYGLCWTAAQVGGWLKNALSAAILARCDAASQAVYYQHLIRVDYTHLLEIDHGTMVATLDRSHSAFNAISFTLFWVVLPTILQLILSCIVLIKVIDAHFATVFVISMITLFILAWQLAAQSKNAHQLIFGAANSLTSHIVEKLSFISDIKINNAYQKEEIELDKRLAAYISDSSRGNARLSFLLSTQAFCTGILLTALTTFIAMRVTKGNFQIGDFVMIIGYIIQLTMPFMRLSASLSDLRRNHLALREGFDILSMPVEQTKELPVFDYSYSPVYIVSHASLSIGERLILNAVDFQALKNQLTVIIGPSGSGKSCLLKMLCGLLHPNSGSISLYGVDIRDFATAAIAREVAVVPQHPMILSGSLRENLVFGCDAEPADDFLLNILTELDLAGFRQGKTEWLLDQSVGIQGRELSGGECQRIALARALARKPSVLILDEPTSSVDSVRENKMIACIRKRVPTIIAATHRPALLANADRIYRIQDKGTISTAQIAEH